ncbi:BRO family protein [uncultured Azohydromonas sp.]|jgi:Prophage antirepressor|uniref:BRO-N domain-containing protein n=1 Tax=uncultured Azohydromonas sp. TaxID=487342 RepID=UPI002611757D|nr:BRO family protein [uncultured Azohydromonas sp.]
MLNQLHAHRAGQGTPGNDEAPTTAPTVRGPRELQQQRDSADTWPTRQALGDPGQLCRATVPAGGSSTILTFEPVTFNVVDRNGMPWLRGIEIARALGYADDSAIRRIYARHAGEFTEAMTCTVKLTVQPRQSGAGTEHRSGVPAQTREVRIFSLRGAHLLAMLARTPKAADFRRWVLDVLEGVAQGGAALLARLQAAERAEAQSFAAARRGSLAMLQRKREKPRLLAAVAQAREAVQLSLQLEGGAAI